MTVDNEKDLGQAIKDKEEKIEIKGFIAPRIRRLYSVDKALWCICLLCLMVAVVALIQMPVTGGLSAPLSLVAGTPAAVILGLPTAGTAALVAVAGGGIGILKQLRSYHLEVVDEEYIILYR